MDARQRYEPKSKTRSGISVFARNAQGTPTRSMANPQATKAATVRARILKHADSGLAGWAGGKHAFADRAGLASGTGMGTTYRGVSSLWKSGLDFEGTRPYSGSSLVENVDFEGEGEGNDEDSRLDNVLLEDSDVEWEDERTLIDGLMGFDDECVYSLFSALSRRFGSVIRVAKRIHSIPHFPHPRSVQNKTKRQEVLTESLRGAHTFGSAIHSILIQLIPMVRTLLFIVRIHQTRPTRCGCPCHGQPRDYDDCIA